MFSISSCVTDVPVRQSSFKVQGGSLNWAFFLQNYISEQFANYVDYGIFHLLSIRLVNSEFTL